MTRLAELRRAAECCRDVVAHAREGIAAAGPGFILVVADDEVGADVDRQVRGWHFEVIPPGRENCWTGLMPVCAAILPTRTLPVSEGS
jgi:hypothetical protein